MAGIYFGAVFPQKPSVRVIAPDFFLQLVAKFGPQKQIIAGFE
jgi:hypothetical protein